jgi:hypothetical protein
MVTSRQVLKKLRSLDYRLRLIEGVNKLERDIIGFCEENQKEVVFGYKIIKRDGHVYLEKLPETNPNQLNIDFKCFRDSTNKLH